MKIIVAHKPNDFDLSSFPNSKIDNIQIKLNI